MSSYDRNNARFSHYLPCVEIHTGGPQGGDIRLFGDVADGRGAVSIYSTTLAVGWQGICPDSSWTNSDANTICQDLGYQGGAIAAPLHASVGPGGLSLPRLLYNTSCPSSSSDLISAGVCSFSLQQSPSDCTAPEGTFAALSCNSELHALHLLCLVSQTCTLYL